VTRLFISSTANERVKAARRLGRHRRREQLLLVEGHRQVRSALEAGARVREVYASPPLFLGERDGGLVAHAERRGARVLELAPAAFRSLSSQVRPDGVAAVVERPATGLATLRAPREPLLLVAEAVERPGNLGTIVRTACSAGADALLACDVPTDPFHPETVRGSVGTIFHLPLAESSTPQAIDWCAKRRLRIVVATPDGEQPYWSADLRGGVAIVVGSERHGISAAWRAAAQASIAIPLPGAADSLNVAVAAGIVLFEAARQRSANICSIINACPPRASSTAKSRAAAP
jgi:TrmH family RNA methyltransferase